MTLLGIDVGGTKVAVSLFEAKGKRLLTTRNETFRSRDFANLIGLLASFFAGKPPLLAAAAAGIAGPVRNGRSETTNLLWVVDVEELRNFLGIRRVAIINDLEATAYGVMALEPGERLTLNEGRRESANAAVIAAGTGLGEAILFWDGAAHHPVASEGGHADFAPRNDLEVALLEFLRPQFGHVSYERVLSGPGLVNLYNFLRDTGRAAVPPALAERMAREDQPKVITDEALRRGAPICVQALDLFASLYGARAGCLALSAMALGGIFVAGGIAPKIRTKLVDGSFMAAFRDKGRMTKLLDGIPVEVVLREHVGVLGAGVCAAQLMHSEP